MAKDKNVQIPAGFDISVGREQSAGWVMKEEGNTVQGRLLGRYSFRGDDGKERHYYQVQLQVPCKIIPYNEDDDSDEEMAPVMAPADSIINVDESAALEALEPRASDGGVYDVWFQYKKKTKSKSGPGGFWPVIGPKLRMVKKPPAIPF